MKKVTIDDIAVTVGVSMKTVSRVLNREPNVRAETRDKVLKAAKQMNYHPNVAARGLASNKSYIIVHFHDNPNPDYLERVHQGIHKICRANGYFAVMEPLEVPKKQSYAHQVQDYIDSYTIDGVILTPPLCDDKALIAILDAAALPYVRLSPYYKPKHSSCTFVDDYAAADMMGNHLIDLGHRAIAFICGHRSHGASKARRNGFIASLRRAGLDENQCPVLQGDFSFRSGFSACEQLLEVPAPPTAIFAANDDMAAGAMMAALKAGLDIPGNLSIAGFDGSRIGGILWPALTTIRQPVRGLAERATELLLEHIGSCNKENTFEQLPVRLLLRDSVSRHRP